MSARGGALPRHHDAARTRLEVVRRRSKARIQRRPPRRFAPVVAGAVVAAATVVLGVLLEQVVLAQSAFEMAHLRSRLTRVEAAHQELLLKATKLESPLRIERFATRELGMTAPDRVGYIVADAALRRPTRLGRVVARLERRGPPAPRTSAYLPVYSSGP